MKSSAYKLLDHVWDNCSRDSWERINHSMRKALSLAIGARLHFVLEDFDRFAGDFNWHRWVGSNVEWIYTSAVINGNASCVKAFEMFKCRKPFFGNDVSLSSLGEASAYIHANSIRRQRERLAVGFGVPIKGKQHWVTSFDDSAGKVRLVAYATHYPEGKPKARVSLTHAELLEAFPAPKKVKKQ